MQAVENLLCSLPNKHMKKMNDIASYKNLSLSAYAFGYGCGFVKDSRENAAQFQKLSLENVANISSDYGLGGIEVPVDRYFPDLSSPELDNFLEYLSKKNLRMIFALENFSSSYFKELAPKLAQINIDFVRAKVSNFYGGNRFLEKNYEPDKALFQKNIKESIPDIEKYGVKVLVENHQDVTVADIRELINMFGEGCIGVNWDTGNSYPSGETTSSFMQKIGSSIGNVHLKDYKIERSEMGYVMHRCALGDGIVDFQRFIPALKKDFCADMPFSIELGAMVGREALIYNPEYWAYTTGVSDAEKEKFIDFIESQISQDNVIKSPWEQGSSPEVIAEAEMQEAIKSIKYIKSIIKN